jgi:hypothetical protein
MIFHPVKDWLCKGVFADRWVSFLKSPMPW